MSLCVSSTLALAIALSLSTAGAVTQPWSIMEANHAVRAADLSRNGELLATGDSEGVINIWNASNGLRIVRIAAHSGGIIGLRFSPDATRFVSVGRDTTLKLWSTATWNALSTVTNVAERFGTQSGVSFSPDGALLVAGLDGANNLGLFRASDLALLDQVQGHSNGVNAAVFSPDGKVFATGGGFRGSDPTVKIWDAATRALLKTLQTSNTYGIDDLAFSPDGAVLATGTDDLSNFAGNVQIWNTADWTLRHTLPAKGYILRFSPDNQVLVSVGPANEVSGWSTRDWRLLFRYTASSGEYGHIRFFSFHPDGQIQYFAGDRFDGQRSHGHIAAVPPRSALSVTLTQNNTIRLHWLHPNAQLQMRTNWTGEWTVISDIPVTFQADHPAAFFRLLLKE